MEKSKILSKAKAKGTPLRQGDPHLPQRPRIVRAYIQPFLDQGSLNTVMMMGTRMALCEIFRDNTERMEKLTFVPSEFHDFFNPSSDIGRLEGYHSRQMAKLRLVRLEGEEDLPLTGMRLNLQVARQ
jgi:hypothetical protein